MIHKVILLLFLVNICNGQSPVGKWKKISHTSTYEGQKMDTHAALLKIRPCAAEIVYEINTDGTYRLNAAASGCDESYKNIQQKLYSKTKWKVEGNTIMISATNFAVGQSYTISFSGNRMTWVGLDNQGTIVYQKI